MITATTIESSSLALDSDGRSVVGLIVGAIFVIVMIIENFE